MTRRTLLFAPIVAAIWLAQSLYDAKLQPEQSTTAALHAFTGNATDAAALRLDQQTHNAVPILALTLTAAAALLCLSPRRRRHPPSKKTPS